MRRRCVSRSNRERPVRFRLNGKQVDVRAPAMKRLLDVLREDCGLTGTKEGCGEGECGACTVLLDGQAVKSCSLLAVQAQGCRVTTVEGLAQGEALHPLQQAFMDSHGLQCGFCTPGMMMTAACLLASTAQPTEAEIVHALEGNLCRCTGYVNIVAAVRQAAGVMAGAQA